ncbi:MAG: acyl-CoA dehydrogenase family protein, partial [Bdellovibrionaceae bacterium]|nr:acyl-CoA dehydrogenase family protein [Pseudobdellovibrionaceae bacterium]
MDFKNFDLFNPTPEHNMLRETIRSFTREEIEPQAHDFDRKEQFNLPLFRKLGELGVLGITVPEVYGGAG